MAAAISLTHERISAITTDRKWQQIKAVDQQHTSGSDVVGGLSL